MTHKLTSRAELCAVLQHMAGNASAAAQLAASLPELMSRLEPPGAELMSRPHFDRAALWTYSAQFENVPVIGEAPPDVIRIQHDLWIRGVQCQVIFGPTLAEEDVAFYLNLWTTLKLAGFTSAPNARGLVELNWRVDARQGFISTGTSETLERAALISGDGTFSAPLDWQLQKDQTIEVRCRSLIRDLIPVEVVPDARAALRWVVVTFWGEALHQPSVR